MTEIPEHLLKRAKSARAKAEGVPEEGDAPAASGGGAVQPAAAAAPATPPKLDAPAPPPPPPPIPAYVAAAQNSPRPPWWAMAALVALPLWALMYALIIARPDVETVQGPLAVGDEIYSQCASCHGGNGGGGVGPALSGGAVLTTFPSAADHVKWVELGSSGWLTDVGDTYGAQNKPVNGGMPGFEGTLTHEEIVAVVCHERVTLSGEDPASITDIDCLGGGEAGAGGDH